MRMTIVDAIEGISTRGNAGSTPELLAICGDDPMDRGEALEELDSPLNSLRLDDKTDGQIRDLAGDIAAEGGQRGFRRGFRAGARLMLESLGEPERGGQHEPECD